MRPPTLSVSMPSGSRTSEPLRTGVATSRPNCVSLSPSEVLSGMPITANIIQIAKQIVNATVLETSTDSDCCDRDTMPASVCVAGKTRKPRVRSPPYPDVRFELLM